MSWFNLNLHPDKTFQPFRHVEHLQKQSSYACHPFRTLVAWTQNANCYIWSRRQKRRCHVHSSSPAPESNIVGTTDISLNIKKNILIKLKMISFLCNCWKCQVFCYWSLFSFKWTTTKIIVINFVRMFVFSFIK